jgi:hypothetical protein
MRDGVVSDFIVCPFAWLVCYEVHETLVTGTMTSALFKLFETIMLFIDVLRDR